MTTACRDCSIERSQVSDHCPSRLGLVSLSGASASDPSAGILAQSSHPHEPAYHHAEAQILGRQSGERRPGTQATREAQEAQY